MAPVQIERGMGSLVCPIGTGVLRLHGELLAQFACANLAGRAFAGRTCGGYELAEAPAPAFSLTSCSPSANSSTILSLKAGRSSGLRLVTRPWSTTTSSSTHLPPALRMSVLIDGYEVTVRPLTASASTSTHGPWQIAAIGLPALTKACTNLMASSSVRRLSGFATPPGSIRPS